MVHAMQEVHHTHGDIKIGQIVNIIYVQTPGILFHGIHDLNCLEGIHDSGRKSSL